MNRIANHEITATTPASDSRALSRIRCGIARNHWTRGRQLAILSGVSASKVAG